MKNILKLFKGFFKTILLEILEKNKDIIIQIIIDKIKEIASKNNPYPDRAPTIQTGHIYDGIKASLKEVISKIIDKV